MQSTLFFRSSLLRTSNRGRRSFPSKKCFRPPFSSPADEDFEEGEAKKSPPSPTLHHRGGWKVPLPNQPNLPIPPPSICRLFLLLRLFPSACPIYKVKVPSPLPSPLTNRFIDERRRRRRKRGKSSSRIDVDPERKEARFRRLC